MLYFFEIFVTMIFLYLVVYFSYKDRKKFIIYIYTIIQIILMTISSLYIEEGHYILELGTISFFTGGTFKLILYLSLFMSTFWGLLKFFHKDYNEDTKTDVAANVFFMKNFPILSIICLMYMICDLLISGIPLINSSLPNKYNYYIYVSKLPLTANIYNLLINYIPLFYSIYFLSAEKNNKFKYRKRLSILFIIVNCVYLFLVGFKVSGIRNMLFAFFIPIIFTKVNNNSLKINFKFMKKSIKIVIFFIIAILINYSIFSNGMTALDKFQQRTLALTSHLWWATDYYVSRNKMTQKEITQNIFSEINSVINHMKNTDTASGIAKIMLRLGDINISKYYLENNIRMGGTFLTVSLYNTGYMVTIIYTIIMATIYFIIVKSLIIQIHKKDIIGMFLIYKIMVFFESYLWNSGTLVDFFNIKNLLFVILFGMWSLLPRKINEINKKENGEVLCLKDF